MAYHARGHVLVSEATTSVIIMPPRRMMRGVIANQSIDGY
jgi:hypothetical protein